MTSHDYQAEDDPTFRALVNVLAAFAKHARSAEHIQGAIDILNATKAPPVSRGGGQMKQKADENEPINAHLAGRKGLLAYAKASTFKATVQGAPPEWTMDLLLEVAAATGRNETGLPSVAVLQAAAFRIYERTVTNHTFGVDRILAYTILRVGASLDGSRLHLYDRSSKTADRPDGPAGAAMPYVRDVCAAMNRSNPVGGSCWPAEYHHADKILRGQIEAWTTMS